MNQVIDFSKQTFRCHMLGILMTEAKGDSNLVKYNKAVKKLNDIKETQEIDLANINIDLEKKISESKRIELNSKKDSIIANSREKMMKEKAIIAALESEKNKPHLSLSCIKKLLEIYVFEKTGKRKDVQNYYVRKGNEVEDNSISLLSDIEDKFFVKNEERKFNDYINGICDIDEEDEDMTTDMKSSWDYYTHINKTIDPEEDGYEWQGQGYMWLWNRKFHRLVHALIDTPEGIIVDAQKRLLYAMGSDKRDTEIYRIACEELRASMTFSDIPKEERILIKKKFAFDPEKIERLKKRIEECRIWLQEYAEKEYRRAYEFGGVLQDEEKEEVVEQVLTVQDLVTALNEASAISTDEKIEEFVESVESQLTRSEEPQSEEYKEVIQTIILKEEQPIVLPTIPPVEDKVILLEASQIDIEQIIHEEKTQDHTGIGAVNLRKRISDCKTPDDCLKLYQEHKVIWDQNPTLKNELLAFKKKLAEPSAPVLTAIKPASVELPKVAANIVPIVAEIKTLSKEVIEKRQLLIKQATEFTKASEVRTLWSENRDFLAEPDHKDIRDQITLLGKSKALA